MKRPKLAIPSTIISSLALLLLFTITQNQSELVGLVPCASYLVGVAHQWALSRTDGGNNG